MDFISAYLGVLIGSFISSFIVAYLMHRKYNNDEPSNPSSIITPGRKIVKITLSGSEKRAIEEVIISGNTMKPLQLQYLESYDCIHIWRGEPVDN